MPINVRALGRGPKLAFHLAVVQRKRSPWLEQVGLLKGSLIGESVHFKEHFRSLFIPFPPFKFSGLARFTGFKVHRFSFQGFKVCLTKGLGFRISSPKIGALGGFAQPLAFRNC